jgi:LuxR family maltose regulon positive regulatory protein
VRERDAPEAPAAPLGRLGELPTGRALRAVLLAASGDPAASPLLSEAAALADIGGMQRVLLDAHPDVARLLGQLSRHGGPGPSAMAGAEKPAPRFVPAHAGALLTPKESHILSLLATGLSNKLIARAMEISDETVKWHLKNLFAKLSAGSRKHAVGRARLLGLLPD